MSVIDLLSWHAVLAIASFVMSSVSVYWYVQDMRYGNTRPNIVSFLLWSIIGGVAFAAQLEEGASWSVVVAFLAMIEPLGLFLFAVVRKYGYREYKLRHAVCFALTIVAIYFWILESDPMVALALSIVADFIAYLPTLDKAWRDPDSEHLPSWLLVAVSQALGAASTEIWDAANLAFPVYLALANGSLVLAIYWSRKRKGA